MGMEASGPRKARHGGPANGAGAVPSIACRAGCEPRGGRSPSAGEAGLGAGCATGNRAGGRGTGPSATRALALTGAAVAVLAVSSGCSQVAGLVTKAIGSLGDTPAAPQLEAATQVLPSRVTEDSSVAIWGAVSEAEGSDTPLLNQTEHTRFGGWNLLQHGYFGVDEGVARSTGRIADTFAFSELRGTGFDDMAAVSGRAKATYRGKTVGALVTVDDEVAWFGGDAALELDWDPASTERSSVSLELSGLVSPAGDLTWGDDAASREIAKLSFPSSPITVQDGRVGFSAVGTDSVTRIEVSSGATSSLSPSSGNWATGSFVGQHASGMPSAGIGRWSVVGGDKLFLLKSDSTAKGRFLVGSFGVDYYNIEEP